MYAATRYSAGILFPDLTLTSAVHSIKTVCRSLFWVPRTLQSDGSFIHDKFVAFLTAHVISFRHVPPRRHSKNVLESKHGVILFIFLRLIDHNLQLSASLAVQQALRISNDLYGSHLLCAYDLAKRFTRPHARTSLVLPPYVFESQETLIAKHKMAKILCSKSIVDIPLEAGDLVDVYILLKGLKRGKWSSPCSFVAFDRTSWTVTVPASHVCTMNATLEDFRSSIGDYSLAALVQASNDELDAELGTVL